MSVPLSGLQQREIFHRRESDGVNNLIEENQPTPVELSFVGRHPASQIYRENLKQAFFQCKTTMTERISNAI